MGVYNLSDNVGESVGPMIFGPLMASGNLLVSMGQFVSVIFGAGALYCLGSLRKPKRKKGGRQDEAWSKKEAQQQDRALLLGAGGSSVYCAGQLGILYLLYKINEQL